MLIQHCGVGAGQVLADTLAVAPVSDGFGVIRFLPLLVGQIDQSEDAVEAAAKNALRIGRIDFGLQMLKDDLHNAREAGKFG